MTVARWRWLPALALLGACATYAPPRFAVDALPRGYEGHYLWAERATECGYQVVLTINVATQSDDGTIAVNGSIDYEPGDNRMTVDGWIDPVTLRVRLRESAPNHAAAVVNGTFEGRLSADLRSLVAIWSTDADGRLGGLVLRAP